MANRIWCVKAPRILHCINCGECEKPKEVDSMSKKKSEPKKQENTVKCQDCPAKFVCQFAPDKNGCDCCKAVWEEMNAKFVKRSDLW
jgi:hypothetical protein